MRNIIFYVHRTGLLGYFVNPICSFLKEKYQITILHLDKRNGYTSQGDESYNMIDLSDYSIENIQKKIKEINPQAIIFLGFISIYELLMLRIATNLHFKTIYLEHGIYSKDTSSLPLNKIINNFGVTLKKNLFFLSQYQKFISTSSNPKFEKLVFRECILKKDYKNSKFSKSLFFSDYGYKQIDKLFHFDIKNIDFVCYPLTYSNKEFDELKMLSKIPLSENRKAILIHQPFILDGLVNWSYEDEKKYFLGIAEKVKRFGYNLTLLIHPRENIERYRNIYKNDNVEIKQNINKTDYKEYSLVIGHYSTALLYPIFLHIPILIIDYGKKIKSESSTFYPLSVDLPISNFPKMNQSYDKFCEEYIGKSKCSFENVASILDKNITLL